ncbi:MAG: serine/threonine protein kinase [Candidatus Aminicenantes bacterium]|nr:serine/threonine protein kinase [Candidatus Aminicenantes bacterium]
MRSDEILKKILDKFGPGFQYIENLRSERLSNVYLVKNTHKDRDEVLKVMDTNQIFTILEKEGTGSIEQSYEIIKKRFAREAALYTKFNHPNIARVYHVSSIEDEGGSIEIPFLLMEYLKGQNLQEKLKDSSSLLLDDALEISQNILNALSAMHNYNVVHRDLNSRHVIITEHGNPVITYFGLAKNIIEDTKLTKTGAFLGTPEYMAPEQFKDSSRVDTRTDIYALGVILFEMLTNEPPFRGSIIQIMKGHMDKSIPDVRKKKPDLPLGIQKVIEKAMAKKIDDRYKNAEDMLKELKKIKEDISRE